MLVYFTKPLTNRYFCTLFLGDGNNCPLFGNNCLVFGNNCLVFRPTRRNEGRGEGVKEVDEEEDKVERDDE